MGVVCEAPTFLVPVQGFGPLRNTVHTVGFDFSGVVRLAS